MYAGASIGKKILLEHRFFFLGNRLLLRQIRKSSSVSVIDPDPESVLEGPGRVICDVGMAVMANRAFILFFVQ